jgi:hypothetical protein
MANRLLTAQHQGFIADATCEFARTLIRPPVMPDHHPLRWFAAVVLLLVSSCIVLPPVPVIAASACRTSAQCIVFPADAGMVNVQDFGAHGNGISDDTPAFLAALSEAEKRIDNGVWTPLVYVPPGIYRVTETIEKRDAKGDFDSGLMLQGAGPEQTIIQLDPDTPGFGDAAHPRPVILTTSHLWGQGGPYGGGKNWPALGEGNQAFQNTVRDLSIRIGRNNPGAIAIDYLGNNNCTLRNLRLEAEAGSGHTALSLRRKWPGPCLIQGVTISGFDVGVHVAHSTYGVTLLDITFNGQSRTGIVNEGNVLSIAHVHGRFKVPVLENSSKRGLVVLAHGNFYATRATTAFKNQGVLRLAGVVLDGFKDSGLEKNPSADRDLTFVGHQLIADTGAPPILPLPVVSSAEPTKQWTSVADFGANGNDTEDDSTSFQAAFDSDAATIYIPFGIYYLERPISFGSGLRLLVGMNAELRLSERLGSAATFDTSRVAGPLVVEDLRLRRSNKPSDEGGPLFRQGGKASLVLRDIMENGPPVRSLLLDRTANGGPVTLLNVCCGRISITGSAPVFAYQLNTEGEGVRVSNEGGRLTILGLKTEGMGAAVVTNRGGSTEILGGLLYPVRPVPTDQPALTLDNARMRVSLVDTTYPPGRPYSSMIATSDGAWRLAGCSLPGTVGTMIPVVTIATSGDQVHLDGVPTCR